MHDRLSNILDNYTYKITLFTIFRLQRRHWKLCVFLRQSYIAYGELGKNSSCIPVKMVYGALNIPCLQFLKLLCLISTLRLVKSSKSETATVWTEQYVRIQHIHTFSDDASDSICEPISSPLDNFCCCSVTSTVVFILILSWLCFYTTFKKRYLHFMWVWKDTKTWLL